MVNKFSTVCSVLLLDVLKLLQVECVVDNLEERDQVFLKKRFPRFLNRKKDGISDPLDESTSRLFLFYGLPGMGKVLKFNFVKIIIISLTESQL